MGGSGGVVLPLDLSEAAVAVAAAEAAAPVVEQAAVRAGRKSTRLRVLRNSAATRLGIVATGGSAT